jgi:glycosyltransferase involved in cell wall biosynthesis
MSSKRKIVWVSFLILDTFLHKISRLEILKSLTKLGYRTELLAVVSRKRFQGENQLVQVISIPLRYIPIMSCVMFSIALFFLLPFYIIFSKPDYIITESNFSMLSFIPAVPFSRLKKIKLVLDIRSTPVETFGVKGYFQHLRFCVSVIIAKKFFDGITIITPIMKEEICRKFNLNTRFVGIWSSGVDTSLFDPKKHVFDVQQIRKKLGLSQKFIVFYHGAFSATRGLTETIEAMHTLKHTISDVVLFLLGTGDIIDNLKKLIVSKGLQNKVIIHNPVEYSDVPKYIAMADVCIVPLPDHEYWRSQCPLNLLEYLAMEKVVIVTGIPAHRFIIGEEKCAIYVPSAKSSELAKAIEYAYRNKDKLAEWGKGGRRIIEKRYRWEKIAMDLEKYLLGIKK